MPNTGHRVDNNAQPTRATLIHPAVRFCGIALNQKCKNNQIILITGHYSPTNLNNCLIRVFHSTCLTPSIKTPFHYVQDLILYPPRPPD